MTKAIKVGMTRLRITNLQSSHLVTMSLFNHLKINWARKFKKNLGKLLFYSCLQKILIFTTDGIFASKNAV